jgi:hypothetical protein
VARHAALTPLGERLFEGIGSAIDMLARAP